MSGGVLVLAATPIGDPRDAAPRLADELRLADVVAAEDTRRLRRLCQDLDVNPTGRVVSYHEHNEAERTPDLVERLREGARVLVVTDAGMPSVSDPGYRLVSAAVGIDVRVTCVPGPSAVLMALAVSGLPVDRFCFEGFLSRRAGERASALAGLAREPRTMVFFEAPHRLARTLSAMEEAFGADRRAAVCRELTKTYEEVRRGSLAELVAWASDGVRGEVTLVVAGSTGPVADLASQLEGIRERVAEGERLKDVCADVAAATGLSKKALYDAAVAQPRR
jgi:16S rRNA (cytidine1402-2'-O)-methyltransferase